MKKLIPQFTKRALALVLSLVLLLSLCPTLPLKVEAGEYSAGWEIVSGFQKYIDKADFTSSKPDLVYYDDEDYDWEVTLTHNNKNPMKFDIEVTIINSVTHAKVVEDSYAVRNVAANVSTVLAAPARFTGLTKELFGTFELRLTVKANGSKVGELTKEFSRVKSQNNDDPTDVEITSNLFSRSNPDLAFTTADPLDLVLRIYNAGNEDKNYDAAVYISKNGGADSPYRSSPVTIKANNFLPFVFRLYEKFQNLVGQGEGIYTVKLVLTIPNTSTVVHESTSSFAVVNIERKVGLSLSSQYFKDYQLEQVIFPSEDELDVVLNAGTVDGVKEAFYADVTMTQNGKDYKWHVTYPLTGQDEYHVPLKTLLKDANLAEGQAPIGDLQNGLYTVSVTLRDDAYNLRGSTSGQFKITNHNYITIKVKNEKTGHIYTNNETLDLTVARDENVDQAVTLTYKVYDATTQKLLQSKTINHTLNNTSPATLSINLTHNGSFVLSVEVDYSITQNGETLPGKQKMQYYFSHVLSEGAGSLSLLNMNVHYTNMTSDPMVNQVALTSKTGATMWRSSITWDAVESTKGNHRVPGDLTRVMDATKNNGMQALVILAYNNNHTNADGTLFYGDVNPYSDTWKKGFADYCYFVADQLAQHYSGCVVGFEIWNEWNHATMGKVPKDYRNGAAYAEVVKIASEQIRKVNTARSTNFKVIAGASAGDGYEAGVSQDFIKQFLAVSGIKDYFDGFSFHTYPKPEDKDAREGDTRYFNFVSPEEFKYSSRISNVDSLLKQYIGTNHGKEIWLTETGWSTVGRVSETDEDGDTHITTGVTEAEAAAYMVRLYTWALADGAVDRIFWYDFMNDQKKDANDNWDWFDDRGECNWGLIHSYGNTGNEPLAYSAKLGYIAMCAMSSILSGATNGEYTSFGGNTAYRFTKDGKNLVVTWAGAETKVNVTFQEAIAVYDMYGNKTEYTIKEGQTSGSVELSLSASPIYVEYSNAANIRVTTPSA